MVTYLSTIILFSVSLIAVCSKLFFLAPTRRGVLVMLSNVLHETLFKRFGWRRWPIDAVTLLAILGEGCPFFVYMDQGKSSKEAYFPYVIFAGILHYLFALL